MLEENKIKTKINALFFSGMYTNNKRGVPFIDNRFIIMKNNNISKHIYFVPVKDSTFVYMLKRILFRKPSKLIDFSGFTGEDLLGNNNWCPMIYNRNIFNLIAQFSNPNLLIKNMSSFLQKKIDFKEFNIANVHLPYPEGAIFSEIKKRTGLPYVLTLHGSDIHQLNNKSEKIREITIEALENADKCIFVSEKLEKIARKFKYTGKNSIVIPNGFNSSFFYYSDKSQAKNSIGIKSKKLVGFVGNFKDIKNVMMLPEIFEIIKDKFPSTEFVIIGDGILRERLELLIEKKGLEVIITGNINQAEVGDYMRAMDIMILPSKNEGWPCVIKEAQACGTYVIGSDRGGIPEAIGSIGKTFPLEGFFIKNTASHILNIFKEGYDIDSLVRDSHFFTWENIVEKEINVYKKILSDTNNLEKSKNKKIKELTSKLKQAEQNKNELSNLRLENKK